MYLYMAYCYSIFYSLLVICILGKTWPGKEEEDKIENQHMGSDTATYFPRKFFWNMKCNTNKKIKKLSHIIFLGFQYLFSVEGLGSLIGTANTTV